MVAGLDVVIRAHGPARLDALGRAVFSAALQDVRPLTVLVALHGSDPTMQAAVRAALEPTLAIVPEVAFAVTAGADVAPRGRYLAFMGDGDVVYPEGHRLLIAELEASGAAVAVGGVLEVETERAGLVPYTRTKRRLPRALPLVLSGEDRRVHGCVLDRERIDPADLGGDGQDLLRRVCARYPSSFRLADKVVGEHAIPSPGGPAQVARQRGLE